MIGTLVYVTDDTGKMHLATVTGEQRLFGPFKRYELVVEHSGQMLWLFPEQFIVIQ